MKLVYIAGPFTPTVKQRAARTRGRNPYADQLRDALDNHLDCVANIQRATALALRVAESGHMPVCPHSNTGDVRFLALQTPEFWYAGTLELMSRCDAIALTDDWAESNGACREVIEAWSIQDNSRSFGLWRDGGIESGRELEMESGHAKAKLRSRGQDP